MSGLLTARIHRGPWNLYFNLHSHWSKYWTHKSAADVLPVQEEPKVKVKPALLSSWQLQGISEVWLSPMPLTILLLW